MKQICFFFLIFTFKTYALLSQNGNTFPTLKDNPKWYLTTEQYGFMGSTFNYPTLKYEADMMLCGKKYAYGVLGNKSFYVRTEGDKTYLRNNEICSQSEELIYDFGMKVGDTLEVKDLLYASNHKNKFKVKSVDTILFEGKKLKRLHMQYTYYNKTSFNYKMEWIEGVGSNEHPLYPLVRLTSYELDGERFYTLCTYHHNNLIYSNNIYKPCSSSLLDTVVFPLYKDATNWNVGKYETASSSSAIFDTEALYYEKDTTICGKVYSKINLKGQINRATAFVRRVERKVYYRPVDANCGDYDYLLYDFELKKGDLKVITHPVDGKKNIYILKKIESVSFSGKVRQKYTFDILDFDTANKIRQDIWLEGVGSLIHPFHAFLEPAADGYWFELLCSNSFNEQQYINPKFNTCFISSVPTNDALSQNIQIVFSPNPFYNTLIINIIEENEDAFEMELFNNVGQKIMQQNITAYTTLDVDFLPKGAYFIKIKSKNMGTEVVKRVLKM